MSADAMTQPSRAGWRLGFNGHDVRLLFNFARMMLRDRFLGSALGGVWALLQPALMLAVFVFVFTVVFPSRAPGSSSSLAFVIWLISGYGPWLFVSEGLNSAAGSVVGQTGLVKNLAFKTELLPIASATLGFVPLLVSIVMLAVLLVLDSRAPTLVWLSLLGVLLLQYLFIAGLGLYLGALTVFVRDIPLALPSVLTMMLFLSPIFYPISAYPDAIQTVAVFNPFYVIANCYREPILNGQMAPLWQYVYLGVLATVVFVSSLSFFRKLKTYFHGRL